MGPKMHPKSVGHNELGLPKPKQKAVAKTVFKPKAHIGAPMLAVPGLVERRSSRLIELQEQQTVKPQVPSPKRTPASSFAKSSMKKKRSNEDGHNGHADNSPKKKKTRGGHRPHPAGLSASPPPAPVAPAVREMLTPQEKYKLQEKIDKMTDEQIEHVIEFLAPDLKGGSDEEAEVNLDLEALTAERQHELVFFVDKICSTTVRGLPPAPTVVQKADSASAARQVS